MTTFTGYIGTYTKGDSKGLYSFSLDTETKKLGEVKVAAEASNPTYLAISDDNQTLYAVEKQDGAGGIAAYTINKETRDLTLINSEVTTGASPCHISVNHTKHVLAAHYHRGTIELYKTLDESGKVSSVISSVQLTGTGPHPERQEKPHTHYAGFTPDEKYIVVVDLGIDKVITYNIIEEKLSEVSSLSVKAGSGPRHIAFHPNGKYAYVMTELSNEVIALAYNSEDGSFTEIQYSLAIPADFSENSQGSAIHLSSDGRFVYAGNRGHNSIAIFKVNQDTGKLTFVEYTHTEGNWPRDFVLDPSEEFLIASNEESSNLVLYSRDQETGKLTLIQSDITVPFPVCVKFLNA